MLTLPPGFDVSALVNDLFSCALPFGAIFALFVGYAIIRKALNGAG